MRFKELELKNQVGRLTSLELGTTSRCNFACAYCCAYGKGGNEVFKFADFEKLVSELPDLKRVKLSGGEVLIHFDDCVQVIEKCSRLGIETQVNTNGSLLTPERIHRLKDVGLSCLHYSMNFSDSTAFQSYYRVGALVHRGIIENIARSVTAGIPDVVVETILSLDTAAEIMPTSILVESLGVRRHELQYGVPRGERWRSVTSTKILRGMIQQLAGRPGRRTALYFSCVRMKLRPEFVEQIEKSYADVYFPHCIEGRSQLHVHANGDILICELGYPVVLGNWRRGDKLTELLANPSPALEKFRRRHGCLRPNVVKDDHEDSSASASHVAAFVTEP